MVEPTYTQYKILKDIAKEGKKGYNNDELTNNHWELVRSGYVNNLVSLGVYSWIFVITAEGTEYIESQGAVKAF